jgi:hypothetical protein
MANKNMQGKQSAPRYASIMGQPHMLAYINREEEDMIRKAGGAGTPGPGGVPAYWTLTEPSTWAGGSNYVEGAGFEGVGNFNASDNNTNPASNDDDNNSPASTNPTNTNVITNPDTEWKTTTMHGQTVQYTGTPGQGDFFLKDPGYMDPYEYMDLIGADYDKDGNWTYDNDDGSTVYSDNAAFDMSHYNKDEDHAADVAFYTANPDSNITTEQYGKAIAVAKALNVATGVLGLGYKAIVELQRRGILPGNTATSYFTENNVPETTQTSTDNVILEMAEAGATNEEIEEELKKITAQESIENKKLGLDTMADAAYGDSNVEDVTANPSSYFSDTYMSDRVPDIDPDAAGTSIDKANYQMSEQAPVPIETVGSTATVDNIVAQSADGYNVQTVDNTLTGEAYKANAQTGEITSNSTVDAAANTINIEETATGLNAVGKALDNFASVDTSRIIDTSTVQGKLLADSLGKNGYVDSNATIKGQLKIISAEFTDSEGNPRIPAWAQSTARNVSRTISFKGMTGTAAVATLSNALMESTLGIAEKEAQFFQTLSLENLSNEQEAVIQKASVLSNMELSNLDARMTAAVQNAKSFLQMDLSNLDNRQQAEILNTQTRVDGIFEDAKAINAERFFSADAANDFKKFYDELNYQVDKHRADSVNEMKRFNTGETNTGRQLQADRDLNREKFYTDLQYNIDLSNADWRQRVELAEYETEFQAARMDAEQMFSLTSEGLNKTWDREDSYFDNIWKSSETELKRFVDLYQIDKTYETEMRKINNEEAIAQGGADYELFKMVNDVFDSDIWDFFD